MALPYVTVHENTSTYRIFREPTNKDGTILEHRLDAFNSLTPIPRRAEIFPSTHHTYVLLDDDNKVSKTYKCVARYSEGTELVPVFKAEYREILDERHETTLTNRITELETLVNTISYRLITVASMSSSISNATGNGARYKFPFTDSNNNWTSGTITLPAGSYEFTIRQILDLVPLSTNHTHLSADRTPTVKPTPASTVVDFWRDADRLVTSDGGTNVKSITSFFTLEEENTIEFYITLTGAETNIVTVNENTGIVIKKL